MIVAYRCAVCDAVLGVDTPFPWRCPNATLADPHHVLHLVEAGVRGAEIDDPNPFVRFGRRMAWWAFARANGVSEDDCIELTRLVASRFEVTPLSRSPELSELIPCEVWVKDETGNVAGSHKARHLVGVLAHLLAAEQLGLLVERPPLAIASCGNAAVAAAALARMVDWPLDVFVPMWMSDKVGGLLHSLGARIHRCERRSDELPGDPAMLRFREAVADGAVPFSVQGPENALCLDSGRTIGWELGAQLVDAGAAGHWRVIVQVGGGALAACVGAGLGRHVQLDTVQAEGCAPLAEAWRRIPDFDHPERHWSQVMRPWPNPRSSADGILDDETYDWIADV
ncbi:MAG: PLP-dependent lyase/thiolase, partial [Solirubrobacterales bacterium]|nr:PLP-dependent lyase/thiolase [Solirubrobacterales bacterium]